MKLYVFSLLCCVLFVSCGQGAAMQNDAIKNLEIDIKVPLEEFNLSLKAMELTPATQPMSKEELKENGYLFCAGLNLTVSDLEDAEGKLQKISPLKVVAKDENGKTTLYFNGTFGIEKISAARIARVIFSNKLFPEWSYVKRFREKSHVSALSSGFTLYIGDSGKQPEGFDYFTEKMSPLFVPDYHMNKIDAWGNPLQYRIVDSIAWVASSGSDGVFEGWDQKPGTYSLREAKGRDIIYQNGKLVVDVDWSVGQ